MRLLRLYTTLARRLHPYRAVVWVLSAAAAIAFVLVLFLFKGREDETYMLAAVTVLMWTLSLTAIIELFVTPPPEVEAGERLLARLGKRLRRAGYWLTAVLMTALCGAVVVFSLRAAGQLARTLGG